MHPIARLTLVTIVVGCAAVPRDACEEQCLHLEPLALQLMEDAGGDPLSSTSWQELCAQAPRSATCEECWEYMQEEAFTPQDISADCGCGFTAEGVEECTLGLVEGDEAAVIAAECASDCPY